MEAIWIWIIIAVIFGILAGLVYYISMRKKQSLPHNDSDEEESEHSNSSNWLLLVLVCGVVAFLIIWLVTALMGISVR